MESHFSTVEFQLWPPTPCKSVEICSDLSTVALWVQARRVSRHLPTLARDRNHQWHTQLLSNLVSPRSKLLDDTVVTKYGQLAFGIYGLWPYLRLRKRG